MPMGLCESLLDFLLGVYQTFKIIYNSVHICLWTIPVTHAVLFGFEPISLSMLLDIVLRHSLLKILFQQSS